MVARLIIVSNRVAVPEAEAPRQAGGLAVAVDAALKRRDGLWFGWSGRVRAENAATEPTVTKRHNRTFITLDLSAVDYEEYYNGFANRVLWPILHYRVDLAEFTAVELDGYLRVNGHFAEMLSRYLEPDDMIWVHDYHLLSLAKELRARGHRNPIGFFLHIPCPPPDILLTVPKHRESLGALEHYDLVGVQTEQDADNLRRYFAQAGRPSVRIGAFPVGIATAAFARTAQNAAHGRLPEELRASLAGKRLILGVDRLDYTKGIAQRIQAFGHFLERHPEWLSKVTYLQLTPKSRTAVPEYADMDREISTLVGQINGRHGNPAWTPIRYINRSYSRTTLAGFYRSAHVGLVTPLRDGMNLVAKEYVAAQDAADPGVLVLSRFAGAAEELTDALTVNPHDPEAMSSAIRTALEMPQDERVRRHHRLFAHLATHDIEGWAQHFLEALAESRRDIDSRGTQPELFATPA